MNISLCKILKLSNFAGFASVCKSSHNDKPMRVVRLSLRKNMNLFICKDLILFNFSLRFHTDAEDIHNGSYYCVFH